MTGTSTKRSASDENGSGAAYRRRKLKHSMHSTLGRDSLKSLADDLELEADRRCVEQMRQVLSRCHRATLKYLAQSPNEFDAKAVCESLALGIDGKGRRQAVIV